MPADLLVRKRTAFVLWRVADTSAAPSLVLFQVRPGAPLVPSAERVVPLTQVQGFPDLWQVSAAACELSDNTTYHYWFEVSVGARRVRITDPTATAVDWRVVADAQHSQGFEPFPASVVRFTGGRLVAADVDGPLGSFENEPDPNTLPTNNQLVVYELPTAWTRQADAGGRDTGVGSFRDVRAMFDPGLSGDPFTDSQLTRVGEAYLRDLGINALELLPPADSFYNRQWGYGTTNFCAPDFELGFPRSYAFPTPNRDLIDLVRTCHQGRVRVLVDGVMAFSKFNPYLAAAPDDFFIRDRGAIATTPTRTTRAAWAITTFVMALAPRCFVTHASSIATTPSRVNVNSSARRDN